MGRVDYVPARRWTNCALHVFTFSPSTSLRPSLTEYVDYAVRHVLMRQGVLGVKVKIMLPYDPQVR